MSKNILFHCSFWRSALYQKIKEQGEMRILVYVYLCTNSLAHAIGIYKITYDEIGHALGMSSGLAKNHLDNLEKIGVCRYDEDEGLLWLYEETERFTQELKPRDKRVKGALNLLTQFEGSEVMDAFRERYKTFLERINGVKADPEQKYITKSTIELIFKFWQEMMEHPRAKLDKKRYRAIQYALTHYTMEEVMEAIRGCRLTPYNMGENPSGQRYDEITLILRDASHIERFIRHATTPPKPRTRGYVKSGAIPA